jgi:FkbM family methyltransferase
MTSIMALRVGHKGRVVSFEPHPFTFVELVANVQRWAEAPGISWIRAHPIALSDVRGNGMLEVPGDDSVNRALASVAKSGNGLVSRRYPVDLHPLVDFVPEGDLVGVLKVDVEGGEFQVLKGAEPILRRKGIRDIIFEEYQSYPTIATEFLEGAGYTIFSVGLSLWGLVLSLPGVRRATRPGYIPTYLATIDPERAVRRLETRGWATLRPASHRHGQVAS